VGGAPTDKLVCFRVAGQDFAAPIASVKETLSARPITRLFLVPRIIAGLVNLRGEVVAILDLATLMGLGDRRPPPPASRREPIRAEHSTMMVLLRSQRAGRTAAGLLVDELLGVRDLPSAGILPPPPTLAPETVAFLKGVAAIRPDDEDGPPKPTLVLDIDRLLGTDALRPLRHKEAKSA
jgi:purine-binding chemotaxis protein CheW